MKASFLALPILLLIAPFAAGQPAATVAAAAGRFAALALDCVHKEYPNKIAHVLNGDADVRPPRAADAGLLRLLRLALVGARALAARPAGAHVPRRARSPPGARAALARSLTPANIAGGGEVPRRAPGRASFERPYGLAWLLQLGAELREWDDSAGAAMGGDARAARGGGGRAAHATGCRSCRGRSGSASTTRPRSRSAWSSTGRGAPATARRWRSSIGA